MDQASAEATRQRAPIERASSAAANKPKGPWTLLAILLLLALAGAGAALLFRA